MPEKATIHQIPKKDAFKSKENNSVWAHIYSSFGVPLAEFQLLYRKILSSGSGSFGIGRPLWVALTDLKDFPVPQIHLELLPGKDGEMVIYQHNRDLILPESTFVYLSTPYRDGETIYEDAPNILDRIRGIFCLLLGRNFLYQKLFSAEVFNYPSGNIKNITKDSRITAFAEGPYLHPDNLIEAEEISKAIAEADAQDRRRAESAIHYFTRGLEDSDTFLFFWTALEILCGTTENNAGLVRQSLEKIYPKVDVDKVFGFKKLREIRNNWLHRGEIPDINHDTIRYMQCMFLDLLRLRLKLRQRSHLQAICASKDFNLADVGLPDNGIRRARPIARMATAEENALRDGMWCRVPQKPGTADGAKDKKQA